MDRKLQRNRAVSLRQHGFLVKTCVQLYVNTNLQIRRLQVTEQL